MSPKRQSHRRDFLTGRAAVDRLLDAADGRQVEATGVSGEGGQAAAGNRPVDISSSRRNYLVEVGRRAMACEFEIALNAGQYDDGTEICLEVLDLIERLEDRLSVYREHSELSQVNRQAADGAVHVEPELFELLTLAMQVYRQTGGALDITSLPLTRAWGFFRRAGQVPDQDELAAARKRVGSRLVRLDPEQQTVQFLRPEMELSVNCLGKGYALDRGAEYLRDAGITDFLFHGGQSSVIAGGSCGGSSDGWRVGLRHPLRPDTRLAEFKLRERALATSGSGAQFFHYRGRRYGHVIDPRTGYPASGVYSATVTAPSAALADALSTACYVMGPDESRTYCQAHPEVRLCMLCPTDHPSKLRLVTHGLTEEDWECFFQV